MHSSSQFFNITTQESSKSVATRLARVPRDISEGRRHRDDEACMPWVSLGGMQFMLDARQSRENVRRNGINLGFVLCTVDGSAAAWESALCGTVLRSLLVGFLEQLLGGPSCTHPATGHASACETHPSLCSRLHCSCHCTEDRDGVRHIRHTQHSPKKHDPHTNSLHT